MKILMVCLGNICRSPIAEGLLKNKLREHNLNWTVDSAGTGPWHFGQPADKRAIHIANLNGIDLSAHRARQFVEDDFNKYDRIYAMDEENYNDLTAKAKNEDHRLKVEMILNLTYPGQNRSIQDPYQDDDGFEEVFHLLDKACDMLITKTLQGQKIV